MVGGHLDSWASATGATDNGAGTVVAMEVMRILKTLNLKMDRTVRMALWGGEEEGLLGSAAYVKEHFADAATMKPTTEHNNFSSYFNIDNGSRAIPLTGALAIPTPAAPQPRSRRICVTKPPKPYPMMIGGVSMLRIICS